MTTQTPASSSAHPDAPTPRTSASYLLDAIAMAIFVLAIGACALFLDVPYPWIVAILIALVSLTLPGPRITTPFARPRASATG